MNLERLKMAEKSPIGSSFMYSAAFICILMVFEVGLCSIVGLEDNRRLLRGIGTNEIISESKTVKSLNLCGKRGFKLGCGSKIFKKSSNIFKNGSFESDSSLVWMNRSSKRRCRLKKCGARSLSQETVDFAESSTISSRSEKVELITVTISGNSTILSKNRTFELGFFSTNGGSNWYLGIWYASIPIRTYVWVANRGTPVKNLTSATVRLTGDGRLRITDSDGLNVWETENTDRATEALLLDTGNLVLLSEKGTNLWQSFDYPADTWLPGMNITSRQSITCWRSISDPSLGNYSLRLKPPEYGEFELVFNGNKTYWSSGNWTGNAFSGVPEMTVPYIYAFLFLNPFTPSASFVYTETSLENGFRPPLSRFSVDYTGQLKQFTWSPQAESWNMFWSRPENGCRVYGKCGNLGFCSSQSLRPCQCLAGFRPVDDLAWNSGDFSGGCRRESESLCDESDEFEEVGSVSFDGAVSMSFSGSRSLCEESCLNNCSCFGLNHNAKTGLCKNLYGNLLNLRNLTNDNTDENNLNVRIGRKGMKKKNWRTMVLIGSICALLAILGLAVSVLLVMQKRSRRKKEEALLPVTNLKLFTYKELYTVTRGFSEKLGHGGFGAVFRGELSDSSLIAVKRLERPGGGEKEFRAEVPPLAGREVGTGEKWFFPPWAASQIIGGNVAGVVDDRLVDAYDPVEAERAALVAVWCIQDDESARPTMGMVVKMLEGTVEVTVPPPPQLLQALVSGDSFPGVGAVSGNGLSTGDGDKIRVSAHTHSSG
ncbi:hypothetical protein HHK36_028988 [Tetracentron sinense]|uniref:non-specific serine/threonine protein kinase n=1 Tax=Tetracentron sinense TaxID=13715 RepID=A0A834YDE5_TETSI|nr:hypothetical protein HHK36_028988 [Tetracentron sinense]